MQFVKALRMNKTIISGCAFLVAVSIPFFAALAWPGKVISVHDGDTITVRNDGGHAVKVRLYGIDCPEMEQKGKWKEQPFAKEAQLFVQALTHKHPCVEIEPMGESYGRVVAIIATTGQKETVQEKIIAAGLGWHYFKYCDAGLQICQNMLKSELAAQWEQAGLWTGEAMPPWEWRHKNAD